MLKHPNNTESYHFFDYASTTPCCPEAVELLQKYSCEDYGNPSSEHILGQQSAKAIKISRRFFADYFKISPEQVIFTGSGSESDNLAIYGVVLAAMAKKTSPIRVLTSATEHPAVRKTAQSLSSLGVDVQLIPVDGEGQIQKEKFLELLTPHTLLVSIHQVNNIAGSLLPVEELASLAKSKVPGLIFHTDAVQAFGKISVPTSPSAVDLVSISAHKIEGPKGVGALIVLNPSLLKSGLRPLIWGGEQEQGFRSGTQNAGLIAGFHAAAEKILRDQKTHSLQTTKLRERLWNSLKGKDLPIRWNSPKDLTKAVAHIVNLSIPGYPSGPLAKLLEERKCLVSLGSACSSHKAEPDSVLAAMGFPLPIQTSPLRISFSGKQTVEEMDILIQALEDSIRQMKLLLGG